MISKNKAYVVCVNDSIEKVVIGTEKHAYGEMRMMEDDAYREQLRSCQPINDKKEYQDRLFWHVHDAPIRAHLWVILQKDKPMAIVSGFETDARNVMKRLMEKDYSDNGGHYFWMKKEDYLKYRYWRVETCQFYTPDGFQDITSEEK